MSSISFDSVSRVYARGDQAVTAVENVTLSIRDQEFVAIVGPSGCGKTTMLRMAAGLDFPTVGHVFVGGRPVRAPGADRAVVFQQFALFPWKSVRENISFGLKCRKTSRSERASCVEHYLKMMGLENYGDAYPHQLSGGMQQRVAIARSYALNPEVLLMDEPFGALDAQTRILMQEELIRLSRANPRTVLFITHSVEEAMYLADRVVVMAARPGKIREIVDIDPIRQSENWEMLSIDEVMDLESFVHLRTKIWKLLRHMEATSSPSEASLPSPRDNNPPPRTPEFENRQTYAN
jgi:NitT/TauT family transport system ATP-binding protein